MYEYIFEICAAYLVLLDRIIMIHVYLTYDDLHLYCTLAFIIVHCVVAAAAAFFASILEIIWY